MGDRGEIRTLVVDDEPDLADVTGTYLEQADERFTVTTATSARDGLEQMASEPFDCVVSDYDMPELNGIEFLNEVRDTYSDLPFILYTGRGSEEVASKAISAGATDYLQKEAGSGQYTILANRVKNAVEQHESRTNYREIFQKVADAIFVHDPETGRVNVANPQACEMVGYESEELMEMTVSEFSPDRPAFSQAEANKRVQNAMNAGSAPFEWQFESKDGEEFWVEVRLKGAVINGRDQVVAIARDISDRKHLEHELSAERDRHNALFESRTDAIAYVEFVEGEAIIEAANTKFEETLGREDATVVGARIDDLLDQDGNDIPETSQWARAGDRLDVEVIRDTSTGPRTFHLRTAPVKTSGESASGYVLYTDLTDR